MDGAAARRRLAGDRACREVPPAGPNVRWRTPIGRGYSGPAVAKGRVYVMDRRLAPGVGNPDDAFTKASIPVPNGCSASGSEGEVLWTHEYDAPTRSVMPPGRAPRRRSPEGKVFTLGAEGNLCLPRSRYRGGDLVAGFQPGLWGQDPGLGLCRSSAVGRQPFDLPGRRRGQRGGRVRQGDRSGGVASR